MSLSFIQTYPGESNYHLFEQVLHSMYEKGKPPSGFCNSPVSEHLVKCVVALRETKPVGRYALYHNKELRYENKNTVSLGSYECINSPEISMSLLNNARHQAKALGGEFIIGPMEGSTWNNYRFGCSNLHQNFFMEPYNPEYYNDQFANCGYNIIAEYVSNLDTKMIVDESRLSKFEGYYRSRGACFRILDENNLSSELDKIAMFSNNAFRNNFLFTAIPIKLFTEKYLNYSAYFDPELIWISEDESGTIHGFVFAVKDHNDATGQTLIIKSLARKEESQFKGLGTYLAGKINQIGRRKGYKKVIHAFMIMNNMSKNASRRLTAQPYKTYKLYGKHL